MANVVIVYSKPNCPNCEHVKWGLNGLEVPFVVREIEETEETFAEVAAENMAEFKEFGVMAAPVTVFPNGDFMEGFHHGRFTDHLKRMGYDL